MSQMKKLFVMLLVFCMLFSLCACGNSTVSDESKEQNNVQDDTSDDTSNDVQDDTSNDDVQDAATFKVKVVDKDGNAVAGTMVQICKDSCIPAMSDAEGIATFNVTIEDGHKLSVMSCPKGYEYTGEAEIYLESGSTEYTIELEGGN